MANLNVKPRFLEIEDSDDEETTSFLAEGATPQRKAPTTSTKKASFSSTSWVVRGVGVCLVLGLLFYFVAVEDTTLAEVEDQEEKLPPSPTIVATLPPMDAPANTATNAPVESATNAPVESSTTPDVTKAPVTDDAPRTSSKEPSKAEPSVFPKGFGKMPNSLSDTYLLRGKPISKAEKKRLAKKWGSWTFDDYKHTELPPTYPNNDVPREEFPTGSWQTDPVYLEKFLGQSISYVETAMEAILAEYGRSKFDEPTKSFEERAYMFDLTIFPERQPGFSKFRGYSLKEPPGNAGYATQSTLDKIRLRLLHAVMTSSDFHITLGGHSAAAGHGNHFVQSYTLQIQRILEPVLARLNVYHQSRNFAMGGLGTIQSSLGMMDLYGSDADILIWDSAMTEQDKESRDYYTRVALLRDTGKVPVIWGEPDMGNYDKKHQTGWINTMFWGASMKDMPTTEDTKQVKSIPYATWYMQCSHDANSMCQKKRYNATCWMEREDGLEPPEKQMKSPGGQAKWHPGNRVHQLQGRAIAFIVLRQLLQGLQEWNDTPGYALPDEAWHVTPEFERIQAGIKSETRTPCLKLNVPNRTCDIPQHARSEYTPRFHPAKSSIRSIIKAGVKIPEAEPNLYDPPEPFNPRFFDPQEDILSILENGVGFTPNQSRRAAAERNALPTIFSPKKVTSNLEPGQGWHLDTKSNPDACDGTMDSFCGRSKKENCLLNGHNDHRGALVFDSLSGWMILNLEKVKHGLISVGIEDYLGAGKNPVTKDWKCVNGSTSCKEANNKTRRLGDGDDNEKICDTFAFEYAIDGKKTVMDRDLFQSSKHKVQRAVGFWYLLDDPEYTKEQERDVEVAIRMTGCGRETTFALSHVYWA